MIFAGRDDEQPRFRERVGTEPPLDRPAALLVGSAGSGKRALLRRFAEICLDHEPPWLVQWRSSVAPPDGAPDRAPGTSHEIVDLLQR